MACGCNSDSAQTNFGPVNQPKEEGLTSDDWSIPNILLLYSALRYFLHSLFKSEKQLLTLALPPLSKKNISMSVTPVNLRLT